MDTETNFVICLGVRFALHVIKALRLARIEHCSRTVVTRFFFLHYYYYFVFFGCAMLTSIACVACRACHSSCIFSSLWHTHTHARTHARTHTHTHARTHARTHTQGPGNMFACSWQQATVCPLPRLWPWLQVQNADVWTLSNIKAHAAMLEILGFVRRGASHNWKDIVLFFFSVDWTKKNLQDDWWPASSSESLPLTTPTQILRWFTLSTWRRDDKSSSSATARKVDELGQITFPSTKLHWKKVSSNRIWVAYVWLSFCSTSIVVYAVPGRPWSCSNVERTHGRAITKIRQQRTRTDPHRGYRVECTSCEHQASQCSSTAINEQEKLERKRALCLKREEGKRTGLWSTLTATKYMYNSQRTRRCSSDHARCSQSFRRAKCVPRSATKRWRNFRWRWRFTRTGGLCSVLMVLGGGGGTLWSGFPWPVGKTFPKKFKRSNALSLELQSNHRMLQMFHALPEKVFTSLD